MNDAQTIILFVGIAGIVTAILVLIIKLILKYINVTYFIEVEIFRVGENFVKKSWYDCMKVKCKDTSELYQYDLVPFPMWATKEKFPYFEQYAFTKQKDGKACVCYIEKDTILIPFMPMAKIERNIITGESGSKDEIITLRSISESTFLNDEDKHYMPLVEQHMRRSMENHYKNLQSKRSANYNFIFIVVGIGIAAIIIYMIARKYMASKKVTTGT